jgi:hypothetical protein
MAGEIIFSAFGGFLFGLILGCMLTSMDAKDREIKGLKKRVGEDD